MDVNAGAQPPLDQGPPGLLRLDNRWIGCIDEHRAFHGDLPRRRAAANLLMLLRRDLKIRCPRAAPQLVSSISLLSRATPRRRRRRAGCWFAAPATRCPRRPTPLSHSAATA